jgi:hypothetical protein
VCEYQNSYRDEFWTKIAEPVSSRPRMPEEGVLVWLCARMRVVRVCACCACVLCVLCVLCACARACGARVRVVLCVSSVLCVLSVRARVVHVRYSVVPCIVGTHACYSVWFTVVPREVAVAVGVEQVLVARRVGHRNILRQRVPKASPIEARGVRRHPT